MTRAAPIARRDALGRRGPPPSVRLNWGLIAGLVFCAVTWAVIAVLIAKAL